MKTKHAKSWALSALCAAYMLPTDLQLQKETAAHRTDNRLDWALIKVN